MKNYNADLPQGHHEFMYNNFEDQDPQKNPMQNLSLMDYGGAFMNPLEEMLLEYPNASN